MKVINLIFIGIMVIYSTTFSNLYMELDKPIKENLIIINIRGTPENQVNYDFHRVKKGEYLSKIAKEHEKKTKKLVEINELKNPNLIFPKQKIYLNNKKKINKEDIPKYHLVKFGENLIEIASYYEIDYKEIIKLNNLDKKNNYVLYPNQKLQLK